MKNQTIQNFFKFYCLTQKETGHMEWKFVNNYNLNQKINKIEELVILLEISLKKLFYGRDN
jgi:hypothetical protein